ncbi:MAG: tRNA pseudouridine(38-40) synthase TruA [Dysgonamonadaceae bacterium]|jgi:tRNA pseudouridine38-40 synthase|nr:tRNA pseudouridine(38-40) synthase TruA [Dysgonamonadaceae bacterium]
MSRFFITLAYNGKNYVGWQNQPNGISVQQTIEEALSTLLRQPLSIVGAGRTDAGVHAQKMVAHFDWDGQAFNIPELVRRLNGFLPNDIAVYRIRPVIPDAHARFSALSRTYKYSLTTQKDPFGHELKLRVFFTPDIETMNKLCTVLMEYSDFTSFSKLHTDVKTNICRIDEAYWTQDGTDYVFTIKADRFLRNMVRAIVGTLIEAGRGRLDEAGFRKIIEGKNRILAGHSAPGQALFLCDISYPSDIFLPEI